jgi:hypothetical protein
MSVVAPYDTITLAATLLNGLNQPVGAPTQVRYVPVGDTSMRISPTGVLTVRRITSSQGAKVVASVTVGGVTLADTATVVVDSTVTPIPLTSYHLRPTNGHPSIWSRYENPDIPNPLLEVTAAGPTGDVVAALTSSNATVAAFNTNEPSYGTVTYAMTPTPLVPVQEGVVTVTATTTWYGVTVRDSLVVTVIGPLSASILIFDQTPRGSVTPIPRFDPGTLTVAAGAVVGWSNNMSAGQPPVDIIFDDPSNVKAVTPDLSPSWGQTCGIVGKMDQVGQAGDIAPLVPKLTFEQAGGDFLAFLANACEALDYRYFPTPGSYHYRTSAGPEGTVIVK